MDVVHALTSIYDHWKHRMQLPVDEEERERTMASKHDLARQEAVGKRRASPTDGQPMRRSERSDFPPWLRGGCGTREQIRDFSARQLCDMGKFNVHMRRSRSFTRSRALPPLSFQLPASRTSSARPCPPWPSSGSPSLAQERRSTMPRSSSAPAIPARPDTMRQAPAQRLPRTHWTPHFRRRTRTYETRWQE